MTSISHGNATATQSLSRLLAQAQIPSKGLQISDALTDPNKKITLKPDEVQNLLTHVGKLPDAEKKTAVDVLDQFRDRFEIADPAAKNLFLNFVPKVAKPIEVTAPARSVATQRARAATATPVASAKDIKHTDATIDAMGAAAGGGANGEALKAAAAEARDHVIDNGEVKASPDGGRRAYVESKAKRQSSSGTSSSSAAPPADQPGGAAMKLFEQYGKSPFFEDRLMAALGKESLKFMAQMNERLANFDDPKREEEIRQTTRNNMKAMLTMADRMSPAGKAKAATQIADFLKEHPEWKAQDPQLQAWVDKVKALPPDALDASKSPDEILQAMPPADNAVVKAMQDSDSPVRGWGVVFQAADTAERIKTAMGDSDPAHMSEDDCRKLLGDAKELKAELGGIKSMLPEDLQKQFADTKLNDLPVAIDPTSRQVMFQQINLMMNQYQQIMQAFSEIINKLNEMAMDPIRKMGR